MPNAKVTLGPIDFGMTAVVRNHQLMVDEQVSNGGHDMGPGPTEYLLIALASCTAATIKMYANRKQWKIDSLSVEVLNEKSPEGKNIFKRLIHVTGALDDEQKKRLTQIADACPVHKILIQANTVETTMVN